MKSFFKRKDTGPSPSPMALDPPPSMHRAKMKSSDAIDLAPSPSSSSSWDGKCARCRKLMSRCLCHESTSTTSSERYGSTDTSRSEQTADQVKAANDKRPLLETLSGMHQTRPRTRVPLKMTQDRTRERRLRETRSFTNHTVLVSNQMTVFEPSRSVSARKATVDDDPANRFTRSCPDNKWRSSSAITSTIRLAHDQETSIPRSGPPKNLLAYDNKKTTNRFNHVAPNATPPLAPSTVPTVLKRTESGNTYITKPISRRRPDEENPDYSRVWEL